MARQTHFFANTGKPLEKQILDIAGIYEGQKILSLDKVDPPIRIVPVNRVIFLRNPFLDFTGSWTERAGRSLFLEAKSTGDHSLDLETKESGGVTVKQIDNLRRWNRAGAAVGVLWECKGEMRFVTLPAIEERLQNFKKKIHFHQGQIVKQGKGFVLYDFAQNLRDTLK